MGRVEGGIQMFGICQVESSRVLHPCLGCESHRLQWIQMRKWSGIKIARDKKW